MKIVIVGAGSVGRSIAREVADENRTVVFIDQDEPQADLTDGVWVQGDAAELDTLAQAGVSDADVVVAATGDDKVNLVVSLLSKTEFGVPRTVARVNHPRNEWMFDDMWGVDVAVSTPRLMTAMVEEAVSVGRIVTLFSFAKTATNMVGVTVPETSPLVGRTVASISWPAGAVLVGIIRGGRPMAPQPRDGLESRDQLLFLSEGGASTDDLQSLVVPESLEHVTATLPVVPEDQVD